MKTSRTFFFVAVTAGSFALLTAIASAQTKKRDRKPHRADAAATTAIADAAAPLAPKAETASPKAPAVAAAARDDGGVVESKTLDGGARVFKFGELEIEGRLRNPQLVYFLRRVRAEFAAGDLGHRSFFPELNETKNESSF